MIRITIESDERGEGKTTVASQLYDVLTRAGFKVDLHARLPHNADPALGRYDRNEERAIRSGEWLQPAADLEAGRWISLTVQNDPLVDKRNNGRDRKP